MLEALAKGKFAGGFIVRRIWSQYGEKQLAHFRDALIDIFTRYNAQKFDFAVQKGYDPTTQADAVIAVIVWKRGSMVYTVREDESLTQRPEDNKILQRHNQDFFDQVQEFLLAHVADNISFEIVDEFQMVISMID